MLASRSMWLISRQGKNLKKINKKMGNTINILKKLMRLDFLVSLIMWVCIKYRSMLSTEFGGLFCVDGIGIGWRNLLCSFWSDKMLGCTVPSTVLETSAQIQNQIVKFFKGLGPFWLRTSLWTTVSYLVVISVKIQVPAISDSPATLFQMRKTWKVPRVVVHRD